MSGNSKLNKEQLLAINHSVGPLLIIAGAGTGKTTVITERIKHLISSGLAKPSEILALTFTEKASREMQERVDIAMPYGYTQMWISTFHSFCDRVLRGEALHIGLDPKYKLMTEAESVQLLRSHLFEFELEYFRPLGNPHKFLSGILTHFSRLQDEDISPQEYFEWAEKQIKLSKTEEDKFESKKWMELARTYLAYDELKTSKGVMDFGDLITKTLKLFRERPNILATYQKQFKYILIDEFQDTNFAQNQLSIMLSGKDANITVCGDDDQCLPGDTLISTPQGESQIKKIKKGDKVLTAIGKGYLSTSIVRKVLKSKKKKRFISFVTQSGKKLRVTDNHKMFCLIPRRKIDNNKIFYVYLMERQDIGYRMGITNDLSQRLKLERSADRIIAIKACNSITEAHFYESVYSLKYQIPLYPFKPRKRMLLTGKWLTDLFNSFDTRKNAQKLALDLGISLEDHHYCLDGVVRGGKTRVKILLKMCCRRYAPKNSKDRLLTTPYIYHEVCIESSALGIKEKLEKEGILTTKSKKGWRIRRCFTDIAQAGEFLQTLQRLTGGTTEVRFDIGKRDKYTRSALVIPAKNIFEGMYIPIKEGHQVKYEQVVSRNCDISDEIVYDLEIANTHNFIANNFLVHNSIYRFRGAAVSNIIQFRKHFPKAKIVVLTKNYRSTQEVLDRSYDLIQHNNPDRLEVVENIDKKLISQVSGKGAEIEFIHAVKVEDEADIVCQKIIELSKEFQYKDFAILVRANNHAEVFARCLTRHGIPHQFLGPTKLYKQPEVVDLISYLRTLSNFEDSLSFYRLLSMDELGIPSRDIQILGNYSKKYNISLFEAAEKASEVGLSNSGKETIEMLMTIINKHFALLKKETAGQILYDFLNESGLLTKILKTGSVDTERKATNISRFFDKLKSYETNHEDSSAQAVIEWIDLAMELGESPQSVDSDWTNINAVNILTVHAAKGLEFPVVFMVNLVSQRFPTSDRKELIPIPDDLIKEVLPEGDYHIEEERRLFYVGMTRAKKQLIFSAADYYGGGKREKNISQFVFEALGDKAINAESTSKSQQLSFLDYGLSENKVSIEESSPLFHVDYISYSQIDTFNVCPLHYKLRYILKIPTPPTAPLTVGIAIHAALKEFYLAAKASEASSESRLIELLKNNWSHLGFKNKKHEKENYNRAVKYLSGYYKNEFSENKIPYLVEQPFVVPIYKEGEQPLKIGGVMDRVDVTPEGIEIVDYKTGEKVPTQKEVDKNEQLTFYALAASLIKEPPFTENPDKLKLSLYYFEEQIKITTTRTKQELEAYKNRLFEIRKEIEMSDFACNGGFLCQNCEYSLLCQTE
jgi:DNA helicase II / ATP-dependent DNA helicase PcrA